MKMPLLARPARPDPAVAPPRQRAATLPGPQASLGNRIVQRLGERPATPGLGNRIQARALTVGPRGDVHELEAERVASRIVADQPLTDAPGHAPPQIQRHTSAPTGAAQLDPEFHHQLADSRGAPLDATTRDFMESRFGHDFSAVRVHDDSTSHALSRRIAAQAFTHGHHIYMGAGRHAPDTRAGRHLLAHELTHVIQQAGGESSVLQRTTDTTATTTTTDTTATTTTTAAPTATTTTTAPIAAPQPAPAPALAPQVRTRGRAFLENLMQRLNAHAKQSGPPLASSVRATLRGQLAEAYEVGDRRFIDLLARCEEDLTALLTAKPPSFTSFTAGQQAQVTAYAKLKKHDRRTQDRVAEARSINAEIVASDPRPWQKLGSKAQRTWAVTRAERQLGQREAHLQAFNASLDRQRNVNPIIALGVDAARTRVARRTGAAAAFTTLTQQFGMERLGILSPVFTTIVWQHVAAELIRHFDRVSGLDWFAAPDVRVNTDAD